MPIHLGKRPSREGWISFETDSRLAKTKARLTERCLPCLRGLYEQLKRGAGHVELREAWDCWKVTTVVADDEECVRVLERFSERFPEEYVYGKIGGGVGRRTSAVIFHCEEEARRDALARLLAEVVEHHFPGCAVTVSRGCGNPYEQLLGPWQQWQPQSRIPDPTQVSAVLRGLRESLYRS